MLCPLGASATVIDNNVNFVAKNQNPFETGPSVTRSTSYSFALPDTTANTPTVKIPPAGSPTYAQLGASVGGDVSLDFSASLSTGKLFLNLPVVTSLTVPDPYTVRAGSAFTVAGTADIAPQGFTKLATQTTYDRLGSGALIGTFDQVIRPSSGLPSLTTTSPGIAADLGLSIVNHNSAFLQGCVGAIVGSVCTDVFRADLPSLGQLNLPLVHADSTGSVTLLPTVPALSQSASLPKTFPIADYATFTVDAPKLNQAATLSGGNLVAHTDTDIVSATVDLDRLVDDFVLRPSLLPTINGTLGPIGYSLMDAKATVASGLYQDLEFTPRPSIGLIFDDYVKATVNGQSLGAVQALTFEPGDLVTLAPTVFRSTLGVTPFYAMPNELANTTGLQIDGRLDVSLLSASAIGESTGYAFSGTVAPPPLQIPFYTNQFGVDIAPVLGSRFDLQFDLFGDVTENQMLWQQESANSDGSAVYRLLVDLPEATLQYLVTGREQVFLRTCPGCDGSDFDVVFLPDQPLVIYDSDFFPDGLNLGEIFCISCTGLSLDDFTALAVAADDGELFYFSPYAHELELPDLCFACDPLLSQVVQRYSFVPDAPNVLVDRPFPGYYPFSVPVPSTVLLLIFGLGASALARPRGRIARGVPNTVCQRWEAI